VRLSCVGTVCIFRLSTGCPVDKSKPHYRLGIDDVSLEKAQSSSHLPPKDFKKALNLVRNVLINFEPPTKKRKVDPTPGPSAPRRSQAHNKGTQLARSPELSGTEDGLAFDDHDDTSMDVDILSPLSELTDEVTHEPRRFRPVFLDYKQWHRLDPRLERELKRIELCRREGIVTVQGPTDRKRR
jgi:hypothetical protein